MLVWGICLLLRLPKTAAYRCFGYGNAQSLCILLVCEIKKISIRVDFLMRTVIHDMIDGIPLGDNHDYAWCAWLSSGLRL
jgi:hypothetical protein